MLSKLIKLIKLHGVARVSNDLGYRSESTIQKWIVGNRIPNVAIEKVRIYLEKNNA